MAEESADDPWYRDGLAFECTRCGNCCTGEPGVVWVNDEELAALSAKLGEPLDEVTAVYTCIVHGQRTLREKANGDCVFFDRKQGCTVYTVRPRQCRTWPFWESNLESPESWNAMARGCPGANQGDVIPLEEITRRMKVIPI